MVLRRRPEFARNVSHFRESEAHVQLILFCILKDNDRASLIGARLQLKKLRSGVHAQTESATLRRPN